MNLNWRTILSWVPAGVYDRFTGMSDEELFSLWHEYQDDILNMITGKAPLDTFPYTMTHAIKEEMEYRKIGVNDSRFNRSEIRRASLTTTAWPQDIRPTVQKVFDEYARKGVKVCRLDLVKAAARELNIDLYSRMEELSNAVRDEALKRGWVSGRYDEL